MEPGKAPREKPEEGYGRLKEDTEAWVGGRLHWSLAPHIQGDWKRDEVEDFESRAKDPRFSTRIWKTTRLTLVAVPSFKLGRRPLPDSARRNGIHIVPNWILAPPLSLQSRKACQRKSL